MSYLTKRRQQVEVTSPNSTQNYFSKKCTYTQTWNSPQIDSRASNVCSKYK